MKNGRLLQERVVAVAALVVVGMLAGTSTASADDDLGSLEFSIGQPGQQAYGVVTGTYGQLHNSGQFPGGLFLDGLPRAVASITEADPDAWTLAYDGPANMWASDLDLDRIVIEVTYEDGKDRRAFHIGGRVTGRSGTTLTLAPPTVGRDWNDKVSERVVMRFTRRAPTPAVVAPPVLALPDTQDESFNEFLSRTTPGGPVVIQSLIVLIVYGAMIATCRPTPWGILLCALALMLTPWVPVFFGYGSTIAASIIFLNILAGAFSYKVFMARTEA